MGEGPNTATVLNPTSAHDCEDEQLSIFHNGLLAASVKQKPNFFALFGLNLRPRKRHSRYSMRVENLSQVSGYVAALMDDSASIKRADAQRGLMRQDN